MARAEGDLAGTGMFRPASTVGRVLCPICGVSMAPNPANICASCLRSREDITAGLLSQTSVVFCPDCSSYLHPPRQWFRAELESRELLEILLRRLRPALKRNALTLVHAEFVFTEPHSKRIRLRLRIQKPSINGAILQQSHAVEFVVQDRLCDACSRANTNQEQWTACVQLRQHVSHRRTFLYLEQLILRHGAAVRALRIAPADHGLDFFFASRSHAMRLTEFLGAAAPVRSHTAKQLVSHDPKSSIYNYKHTFSVEICPICREDLICLPPKVANSLGNLGPIVLCIKVTSSITLLDPFTLRAAYLDAKQYWSAEFAPLLSSRQLIEYIIIDIDLEPVETTVAGSQYQLALVHVARTSDFGKNDTIFAVRTHLGHLFSPGDFALGYDLYSSNVNDSELAKYKGLVLPDAILVKKSYEEKRRARKGKPRAWKLKSLAMDVDDTMVSANGRRGAQERQNTEYEEFLRDLEENPEMRFNISLYRNNDYQPSEVASTIDGDEVPSVPIEELLADLELEDDEEDNNDMAE